MKIHKTKKLFYGKYPYKIELKCPGLSILRRLKIKEAIDFYKDPHINWDAGYLTKKNRSNLVNLLEKLLEYLEIGIPTRLESEKLNFYLSDEEIFKKVLDDLAPWVYLIAQPGTAGDLELLHSKNHIILSNKLPHGKYKFKVMLNTSGITTSKRNDVHSWLKKHNDVYLMTEDTHYWFSGNKGYPNEPFVYVKTTQDLMMLHLYMAEMAKKTYEYVLRDIEINTISEDNVCQP